MSVRISGKRTTVSPWHHPPARFEVAFSQGCYGLGTLVSRLRAVDASAVSRLLACRCDVGAEGERTKSCPRVILAPKVFGQGAGRLMAERASVVVKVSRRADNAHSNDGQHPGDAVTSRDPCLGSVVDFLVGKLIAIEGIDQAGKHTVCSWLVRELASHHGVPAQLIGFPDYTTPLGEVIAQFLRSQHNFPLQVRQHLYVANRWERAAEIRRWLDQGYAVVVDRYSASNIAYGVAQGLDAGWIKGIESGLPPADITLLLDISPEVSLERKPSQRDAYEARLDLLDAARLAYLDLAKDPSWHRIDAAADRDAVRERVLAALQRHRDTA